MQATIHGVAKSRARLSNFTFSYVYIYIKHQYFASLVSSLAHLPHSIQLFAFSNPKSHVISLMNSPGYVSDLIHILLKKYISFIFPSAICMLQKL